MAQPRFPIGKVPVPGKLAPIDLPKSFDPAETILQAAALQQKRDELKQKSVEALSDTVKAAADLFYRGQELKLKDKQADALIELHQYQQKSKDDQADRALGIQEQRLGIDREKLDILRSKLDAKPGKGKDEKPLKASAETLFKKSLAEEASGLIGRIKRNVFDKNGQIDPTIAAELSSGVPLSERAQKLDSWMSNLLEVDINRTTGAAATEEQVKNKKKAIYGGVLKRSGTLKTELDRLDDIYKKLVKEMNTLGLGKSDVKKPSRRDFLAALSTDDEDEAMALLQDAIDRGEVD